jgi:anti-sigma factor RsiW
MSLCDHIDTLAMAYLDDELATEERRELEHHVLDCAGCKQHLDGEREELAIIRKAIAVPPASDVARARVMRALDAEATKATAAEKTARRGQLSRWMLPGSAMFAAVAALAVFVAVRPPAAVKATSTLAHEAIRQGQKSPPLEVQGVGTAPWLRQHFAPTVTLPQFADAVELQGARLTAVNGHDAAQLKYTIKIGTGAIAMSAVVIRDLAPDALSGGGEAIPTDGDLPLHVVEIDGVPAVTYVDANHDGYVFMSGQLSAQEVLRLVVSSNLVAHAHQDTLGQ